MISHRRGRERRYVQPDEGAKLELPVMDRELPLALLVAALAAIWLFAMQIESSRVVDAGPARKEARLRNADHASLVAPAKLDIRRFSMADTFDARVR